MQIRSKKARRNLLIALAMIAPAILIRGFTTVYPLVKTFVNSFYDMSLFKAGPPEFIGFDNYVKLISDEKILNSIEFTVIFTLVSMFFHVVLGVLLALALNMQFKGKKFLRTITLIPWAMPMVVVGTAARWAFDGTFGFINDIIRRIVPTFQMDWLIQPSTARIAVIAVDLWKDVPFFAILVLASLQYISKEVYEAASIDGAGTIKSFFYITVPNISKTVLSISIFFTMWRMTSYDVVYALTAGGPADSTSLIAYRITMEAFSNMNMGYASTISVSLFLVMVVIYTLISKLVNRINVY